MSKTREDPHRIHIFWRARGEGLKLMVTTRGTVGSDEHELRCLQFTLYLPECDTNWCAPKMTLHSHPKNKYYCILIHSQTKSHRSTKHFRLSFFFILQPMMHLNAHSYKSSIDGKIICCNWKIGWKLFKVLF